MTEQAGQTGQAERHGLTEQISPVELVATTEPAPDAPEAPAKKDRRILRAVLRWTAAVVAFGAFGAASAYAVTEKTRTDLPGLATESDGRWDYPEIVKPPLPEGAPVAGLSDTNEAEIHHADLRKLLLPLPKGAKEDRSLRGKGGWLPVGRYLAAYDKVERESLRSALDGSALRHIAARGWTMPDGTRTQIYLLRFKTGPWAIDYYQTEMGGGLDPNRLLTGVKEAEIDKAFPENVTVEGTELDVYDETKPRGKDQTRQAYVVAGDTLALIVQSRKGAAEAVPFHQTVILQNQLLG
ncbi:hypothetical protein [Streptomyces sp. NBC_01304]|uniref:hypothetical protein n=1 Tax=Streptomyces sp. NBC_01304 TaxID=2903818 RepID=UPI002E12207C|nr:hypothetical protein OG430_26885 [Streptomyces sp. NBC_01304]